MILDINSLPDKVKKITAEQRCQLAYQEGFTVDFNTDNEQGYEIRRPNGKISKTESEKDKKFCFDIGKFKSVTVFHEDFIKFYKGKSKLVKSKLTNLQVNFILDKFFNSTNCIGERSIGENLLTNGSCTVAGKESIFVGGIGNFIETDSAKDLVDCLRYTLDLNSFLKSQFFKEIVELDIRDYNTKKKRLEEEYLQKVKTLDNEHKDISLLFKNPILTLELAI